ncbi:MAG: hypothetical protein ABR79_02245 [Cryomorphaceae bacterium BACL11 MAG-121001-bin54]|mgnify:CR=1 FL=1|jgi:hypothetical protein|nr:MAG: hypothetical protein ABR79_02245 [Cryomorphaceae bacterium BACL11 MAG-121001-bin54]KRO64789.1 MAG: hypothetical protein ABR80_05940 [Cryomorphaceae bacterium BACL11 MAG-121015-bin20]KRO70690.1 MAG: hypothetical protein ABR81_00800 [Cryomorphaceae bacterium BACL11 MAG-121128-bin16]
MNKIFSLSLIIGLVAIACSDPNTIGLEVQPTSDAIIISDTSSFSWQNSQTESEDSLRTDEALNLILGKIVDSKFGVNRGSFYTQILLTENNTNLGTSPVVDSVILSYAYSGYYGDLEEFTSVEVNQILEDIYKDSVYYSNSFEIDLNSADFFAAFSLSNDSANPSLRIELKNDFGQDILNLGNATLKDNETFLQAFKGISVLAEASNTILYLNPNGTNSYLKIYYHNNESGTDTLSLDFELGGDAARVNLFNSKPTSNLSQDDKIYIQSMAGYKVKISINNTESIKSLLEGKVINKVTMSFDVESGSQLEYEAHQKLVLVRVNEEGDNVFLSDFTIEGEAHFGGNLENDKYEFNITRYFSELLQNDSYKELYLLPAGAAVNANRTILNKDIKLQIYYSEL